MDSLIFVKFKITPRNQVFASTRIALGTYQGHRAIHDGSWAQPGRGAKSTTLLVPLHQGVEDRQQRRTMASKLYQKGQGKFGEKGTAARLKTGHRGKEAVETDTHAGRLWGAHRKHTEIRNRNPLLNMHFFFPWGRAGPWHWECFDFWSLLIRRHFICKFTKLRI